jgi:hypothetical protein
MPRARTPIAAAKIKRRNFMTPAKKRATTHLTKPGSDIYSGISPPTASVNHFEILIRVSCLR